jgi:hypothetical protein
MSQIRKSILPKQMIFAVKCSKKYPFKFSLKKHDQLILKTERE